MNKRIFYSVFTVIFISATTCNKPGIDIIKDQTSIYYNEQAFPQNNGEIENIIVGNDTVTCEIINNHYVFQGDMILTKDQIKLLESGKGTGFEAFIYKWANNSIFYLIDERIKNKSIITDAIKHWEENSPLKFAYYPEWIKIHPENQYLGIPLNTLMFEYNEDGCYSYVGMIGENNSGNIVQQEIGLADWADKGTVIHEIGHTLGLMHEHSRLDRDQYIRINLENVEPGKEYNFDKIKAPFVTSEFDFNSIMLYSAYAFSKNGSPTITKIDGSVYDAQREVLSEGDKEIINMIYLHPEVTKLKLKNITDKSATCEYYVTSYPGQSITETGIYWGTAINPEKFGIKKPIGTNTGNNTAILSDLLSNTTYYIRAYAVNGEGTSYSDQITLRTYGTMDINSNYYKTVVIGNQEWMAENLKTTKFNDGQNIQVVTDSSIWNHLSTPAYCWYKNDELLKSTSSGALYNWFAVNSAKLCPLGWHVPTLDEWIILRTYLGGETIAGGKLKETGTANWQSPNVGATNESGFTAIPTGLRSLDWGFGPDDQVAGWWTSTESQYYQSKNAWAAYVWGYQTEMSLSDCCSNEKAQGKSVRCLKDN